jgi:hypothetical protein
MFILKSTHDGIVADLRRQLAEKEAERKKLFNMALGIEEESEVKPPDPEAVAAVKENIKEEVRQNYRLRPSQIVRRFEAHAERAFLEKMMPSLKNQDLKVAAVFDKIDSDVKV